MLGALDRVSSLTFAIGALLGGACDSQEEASAPTDEPARSTNFPIPRGGSDLVGTPAKPFADDLVWLSGTPRTLEDLRGRVVFVRFWTDTCPFCQASAPGLSELHSKYAARGLEVVGLFHPKPRGTAGDGKAVAARAAELGMTFPIAMDTRWNTLDRWWLTGGDRAATSVSFLIDRRGTVRWVHPGPELHPGGPADHQQCREDFADAVRAIESLLEELPST